MGDSGWQWDHLFSPKGIKNIGAELQTRMGLFWTRTIKNNCRCMRARLAAKSLAIIQAVSGASLRKLSEHDNLLGFMSRMRAS